MPNDATFDTLNVTVKATVGSWINLDGETCKLSIGGGSPHVSDQPQPLAIGHRGQLSIRNSKGDEVVYLGDTEIVAPNTLRRVGIFNGPLSVKVPPSSSPIDAFSLDVQSFGTIDNAMKSHFFRVRDVQAAPPNGVTHFVIRGDGNVGIGTADPKGELHLGAVAPNIFLDGQTTANQDGMRVHYNGYAAYQCGVIDVKGLSFRLRGEPASVDGRGATDRLFIDLTNGNVGIGTTDPQAKLDVQGDIKVSGDIVLSSADCAEDFRIAGADAIDAGTVMVVDGSGALKQSERAYDKHVLGVISGAGDLKPAITLGRQRSARNRVPLALVGTVYCKVDAQFGPIEVGDMLTTSPTPGYAMKASDPAKAFGSVIGKALSSLKAGTGLVPIIVALQ